MGITREEYKTRLIGEQFGLLKVIGFSGYNKNKQIMYKCECQCKDKTIVYTSYSDLKSGRKNHCGCLTKQRASDAKRKYNTYDLSGEYGVGWTTNKNKEFYFDLEDYDKIKDYCWYEHKDLNEDICGYIESKDIHSNKIVKMHRIVTGVTDSRLKVDHIKHRKYDNRKSQLRVATNQQNTMNRNKPKNNTSGVAGINWDKEKNKWRVRVYHEMKTIHYGYFDNFEEAVNVRNNAVEQLRGEWSYSNSMTVLK